MRALALVLLAAAPLVRWRWAVGALAGAVLAHDVWAQIGRRYVWAGALVVAAGAAAWALPRTPVEPLRRWAGWRWVALLGAAAAAYACVPETDQFREVAVVLAAGAVAEAWLVGIGRPALPPSAHLAAWGLVAWAATFGASGRQSAVVGGLFALLAPVAAGVVARRAGSVDSVAPAGAPAGLLLLPPLVAAVWVVAGVAVARTGGIDPATGPAVVAAGVAAAVALLISAALWRFVRSPRSGG